MPLDFKASGHTLCFSVYVQPRSSAVAFAGSYQNALKIRLTAPPADGAANKQCLQMLAKALGIPKSSLHLISGHTGRLKRVEIRLENRDHAAETIKELTEKLKALAQ